MKLAVHPLTPERWPDLAAVFDARGCAMARGCGCMYYRRSGRSASVVESSDGRAQANRAALKALVDAGRPPGLIGYLEGQPVGWVSLGPRGEFARLARSPVARPVDDRPVWSIVCFVVPPAWRGRGVARALLDGAVAYAAAQGATLLEAYPVDKAERSRAEFIWQGAKSMFDAAGFAEVARRKLERPVLRLQLRPPGAD